MFHVVLCFSQINVGIKTLIKTDLTTLIPGGWFGLNLKQKCSGNHRDSRTSNYVSGRFDWVCAAGWRNFVCEKKTFIIYMFYNILGK